MGDFSRARDITITAAVVGKPPITVLINSGSFDDGLGMEEVPLVGEDAPRVEGINGPVRLQLDTNNADAGLREIIDAQRAHNSRVSGSEFRLRATFRIDFPNGVSKKYRIPNGVLHDSSTSFSGSTERVTSAWTITAQRGVPVN